MQRYPVSSLMLLCPLAGNWHTRRFIRMARIFLNISLKARILTIGDQGIFLLAGHPIRNIEKKLILTSQKQQASAMPWSARYRKKLQMFARGRAALCPCRIAGIYSTDLGFLYRVDFAQKWGVPPPMEKVLSFLSLRERNICIRSAFIGDPSVQSSGKSECRPGEIPMKTLSDTFRPSERQNYVEGKTAQRADCHQPVGNGT